MDKVGLIKGTGMKLVGILNGWAIAPELWRELLWPPLQIHRELTVRIDEDSKLWLLESPVTYSIQVLGVALLVELNRGMSA